MEGVADGVIKSDNVVRTYTRDVIKEHNVAVIDYKTLKMSYDFIIFRSSCRRRSIKFNFPVITCPCVNGSRVCMNAVNYNDSLSNIIDMPIIGAICYDYGTAGLNVDIAV